MTHQHQNTESNLFFHSFSLKKKYILQKKKKKGHPAIAHCPTPDAAASSAAPSPVSSTSLSPAVRLEKGPTPLFSLDKITEFRPGGFSYI